MFLEIEEYPKQKNSRSQLSKMTSEKDTRVIEGTPKVVVEHIPQAPATPITQQFQSDDPIGHLQLAQRYGLTYTSSAEEGQLAYIWNFLADETGGGYNRIISRLIKLENKLGAPHLGTTKLDQVHRYVKVLWQERLIAQEKKALDGRFGR